MKSKFERISELRRLMNESAKPLRDPDYLRWVMDELFAILLNEESSEEAMIWVLHDHPNEDPDTYRCQTPEEEEADNEERFQSLMDKDD